MSLSCPIGPEFDALVSDLKSTAAARAAVALITMLYLILLQHNLF